MIRAALLVLLLTSCVSNTEGNFGMTFPYCGRTCEARR